MGSLRESAAEFRRFPLFLASVALAGLTIDVAVQAYGGLAHGTMIGLPVLGIVHVEGPAAAREGWFLLRAALLMAYACAWGMSRSIFEMIRSRG